MSPTTMRAHSPCKQPASKMHGTAALSQRSRSRSRTRGATGSKLDEKCITAVRVLSAEMPSAAKSGHPGAPLGCAPIAHALWGHTMHFSPKDPKWPNRDRFVLSNGHACALQYAMLHLTGYDISVKDMGEFRKLHSKCPGHPECFVTEGIEVCTGPLGQGLSNSVGLALARAHMAARYDRPGFTLFDHIVYAICGDGCLMEGVTTEACALAGEFDLSNLVVFYDDNSITIDGSTDLAFTEDVSKRLTALRWQVTSVPNGDSDFQAVLEEAQKGRACGKPAFIKVTTTIGYGCNKAGTAHIHGTPLNTDDLQQLRKSARYPEEKPFHVPQLVSDYYRGRGVDGDGARAEWQTLLSRYGQQHPEARAELDQRFAGEYSSPVLATWQKSLAGPAGAVVEEGDPILCTLASIVPELFGGSVAEAPMLGTCEVPPPAMFSSHDKNGRHVDFGAGKEHAIAACINSLAAYGGFMPYWRCPLSIIANAWGAMRLSALSQFRVLHIATHDGSEATEVLALCRASPNLAVLRPADATEVAGAYLASFTTKTRPTLVILPAPGTTCVTGTSMEGVAKGGYVVGDQMTEVGKPTAVLLASGSELKASLSVQAALAADGVAVRVVSLSSWELFEEQSQEYQMNVLGQTQAAKPTLSRFGSSHCGNDPLVFYMAEDGRAPLGFEKFARICVGTHSSEVLNSSIDHVSIAAQVREAVQQARNGA
mmetsp:Transcript_24683/g.43131  ORF Transcript_24683/g.43131 Transcript_24683/m.43131 type:complete len:710 (+) Transcript_24683:58-2187(+)